MAPVLAHQVNVLYVSVPRDMLGGQLEVPPWHHLREGRGVSD